MNLPVNVSFIGMEHNAAVESRARSKASKLERICPSIRACKVMVERRQPSAAQGEKLRVLAWVSLPTGILVGGPVEDEDVFVALRQAFDELKSRLTGAGGEPSHEAEEEEADEHEAPHMRWDG